MIDGAGDFAADFAAQGEALAVGGKAQVGHALGIVGDVFAQQILAREDFVVGFNLDPKAKALGAIAWQIGTTSAAALTVIAHDNSLLLTGGWRGCATRAGFVAHRRDIAAVDTQRGAVGKPCSLPRWKAVGKRQ